MPETRPDPRDNLKYVCDMIDQLRVIAAQSGGPFLAYLLDMAKAEANERLRDPRYRPGSGQD